MNAMTLEECGKLKLEADLLARAAWDGLRLVCLRESTVGERATALAAVEGAERERQILWEMRMELIGSGRVSLEIDSDSLEHGSAVMTPTRPNEAGNGPAKAREAAVSTATPTPE